jgi:hypothetical protein
MLLRALPLLLLVVHQAQETGNLHRSGGGGGRLAL